VSTPQSQRIAYLVVSAALLALGIWILWDFVAALIWAVILAIATWPFYQRLRQGLHDQGGSPIVAPLIATLVIGLLCLVPLGLMAVELGREALYLARWLPSIDEAGLPAPDWVAQIPFVGAMISHWWQANLADPHSAASLLSRLDRSMIIEWTRTLGTQLARRSTVLIFTLLTLFFLYRDGARLVRQIEGLALRLVGPSGRQVGLQMVHAVRGTVNGLVLVGLGEGALLGIAYGLADLPHPVLLGALTAVFAMIPFGAPVILAVGALMLLVQSGTTPAIILFAFGAAVVFVADHFVRPVLIGGAVKLSFLWVLLGILGGLESLGLLGLFLGPAVMAALVALWAEWTNPHAEA